MEGTVASFRGALDAEPRNLGLHKHVAKALERLGRISDAIACWQRAVAIDPGDFESHVLLRNLYTKAVPVWHFPMMNDPTRNDACDRAIRRAVRPGMHVLDIGTAGQTTRVEARHARSSIAFMLRELR